MHSWIAVHNRNSSDKIPYLLVRMEEEARELREREIDDQWKKQLLD